MGDTGLLVSLAYDDTDCDGLADGEEIVRATNPLIADTDGDGLVDGSDPEPLVATSLADIDCDGIADAYENYWFGDTNACNTVTNCDETGFTLSFAPVAHEQRESESTLSSIIARAAGELRKDR